MFKIKREMEQTLIKPYLYFSKNKDNGYNELKIKKVYFHNEILCYSFDAFNIFDKPYAYTSKNCVLSKYKIMK